MRFIKLDYLTWTTYRRKIKPFLKLSIPEADLYSFIQGYIGKFKGLVYNKTYNISPEKFMEYTELSWRSVYNNILLKLKKKGLIQWEVSKNGSYIFYVLYPHLQELESVQYIKKTIEYIPDNGGFINITKPINDNQIEKARVYCQEHNIEAAPWIDKRITDTSNEHKSSNQHIQKTHERNTRNKPYKQQETSNEKYNEEQVTRQQAPTVPEGVKNLWRPTSTKKIPKEVLDETFPVEEKRSSL